MNRLLISFFVAILTFMGAAITASAQVETATGVQIDQDLALLRRDLRSEKKKIIALNVPFTDTEATRFWPVYDQFTAEIAAQNDEFWALVKDYAAKQKVLTDEQATDMLKRWGAIQLKREQIRQKYIPLVGKVVPGRKAALFFQIDRRLWMLLDLQVSSQIPLVTQ